MTIVDNNILSALAKIERLELRSDVFERVGTPLAVVSELDRARTAGYDFVTRIDDVKSYNDGWLEIVSPTQSELQVADDIRDHALSMADAQCLAVASQRERRLVTDDAHVGTIGEQHCMELWDLTLCLKAGIRVGAVGTTDELSALIAELSRSDGYRFSATDENALFEEF